MAKYVRMWRRFQVPILPRNDTYRNGNGETLYKVSIETTSGEKQLFAIANYGSGYWDQSGIDRLCNQAEKGALTLAQLRDGVISLAHNKFNINTDGNLNLPSITASNQMLDIGWNTGVVFAAAGNGSAGTVTEYGDRGDRDYSVAIKMQRSMAHILFNISSNSYTKYNKGVKHTCRFTPSTFRVYNIPMKILIGQTDETRTMADANKVQEYLISASDKRRYKPERRLRIRLLYARKCARRGNVQRVCRSRCLELRRRSGFHNRRRSPAGGKDLDECPAEQYVCGYKGYIRETTGENDDPYYTANVNYTVHLGDFSGNTNYDNFSVVRNYKYTYNMKVQGVDKIVVEAKKTAGETHNRVPKATFMTLRSVVQLSTRCPLRAGILAIYLSSMERSLASGLSDEELDNAIADKLILVIQSEAMDYTGGIGM